MFGRAGINIEIIKWAVKPFGGTAHLLSALSGARFIYMIDLLFTETKNVP